MAVITNMVSNNLANYDYVTRKWCHKFPAMPTGRCAASAAANDSCLVVIGGIAENDRTYLDVVEVLDLATMKWARACPVPKAVTFMSITMCPQTGRIYLLGGYVANAFQTVLCMYYEECIGRVRSKYNTMAHTFD